MPRERQWQLSVRLHTGMDFLTGTRTHTRRYTHGQTPTGTGSRDTHTRAGTDCHFGVTKSVTGDPSIRDSHTRASMADLHTLLSPALLTIFRPLLPLPLRPSRCPHSPPNVT